MSRTDQARFLGHSPPEDTFNDAIDQLLAGTPLADILQSVPVSSRDELSDMLSIVEFTQQVQTSAVPMPSRAKRAKNKASFLAAAQAINAQEVNVQEADVQEADVQAVNIQAKVAAPLPQSSNEPILAHPKVVAQQSTPTLPNTVQPRAVQPRTTQPRPASSRSVQPSYVQPEPSFFQRLSEAIGDLFTVRTVRFAPLIVLLGLILVGGSSIFSVRASIPGDFTYPIKQWVRHRQLDTVSVAERDEMLKKHEIVVADEVRQAVTKAEEKNVEIEAQEILLYYGMEGRRHAIGDLLVSPWHQPDDTTEDTFEPMDIIGQLSQLPLGTEIRLEYQVVPGQVDDDGKPIVQGITLEIIATPESTSEAMAEVVPTPLPTLTNLPDDVIAEPGTQPTPLAQLPLTLTLLPTNPVTSSTVTLTVQAPTLSPMPTSVAVPTATIVLPTPEPKLADVIYCEVKSLAGWVTHIVRRGDTLWDLANRSGTTVEELKEVNCLDSDRIIAGDWLNIPPLQPSATPVVVQDSAPTVIPPTLTHTPQPSPTFAPTIAPVIVPPTAVPPTQTPQPTSAPTLVLPTEIPTEIPTVAPLPTLTATLSLLANTPDTGENNDIAPNYDATAVPLIAATDMPEVSNVITTQNSETSAQLPTPAPTALQLATPAFVTATIEAIEIIEVISTTTVITIISTPIGAPTELAPPTSIAQPLETLIPVITPAEIITTAVEPIITPVTVIPVTSTLPIEISTAISTEIYPVLTPTSTPLNDVLPVPSPTPELTINDSITPTVEVISIYTSTPVPPAEPITTPYIIVEEPTVPPSIEESPTSTPEVNASINEEDSTGLESIDTVGIPTVDVPVDPTATWTPEPVESLPTEEITVVEEVTIDVITVATPTAILTTLSITETEPLVPTDVSPTEIPLIENTPEPPTSAPTAIINPTENNIDNNAEENPVEPEVILLPTATTKSEFTPVPTDTPPTEIPLIENTPEPPTSAPTAIINPTENNIDNNAEENPVEPEVILLPTATTESEFTPVPTDTPPTEIPLIENTPEPPTSTPENIINPTENNIDNNAEENSVEPEVILPPTTTETEFTPVSTDTPPTEIPLIENTPEPPTSAPTAIINPTENNIDNNTEENSVEPEVILPPTATTESEFTPVPTDTPPTEIPLIENTPEPPTSAPTAIINLTESNTENNTEEYVVEPTATPLPTALPTEVPLIENTPEQPMPVPTPIPAVIVNPTESNTEENFVEPTAIPLPTVIPTATPIAVEPTATAPPAVPAEVVEPTATPEVIHMFSTPTVEDSSVDSSNTDVISVIEEPAEIPSPPTAVPVTTGSERVSPLVPPSLD